MFNLRLKLKFNLIGSCNEGTLSVELCVMKFNFNVEIAYITIILFQYLYLILSYDNMP
jgi:hypothetical protein